MCGYCEHRRLVFTVCVLCDVLRAAAGVFVLPAVEVEGDEFEDVIKDQRGALQVDDWGRQRRMNDFLFCVSVCTF